MSITRTKKPVETQRTSTVCVVFWPTITVVIPQKPCNRENVAFLFLWRVLSAMSGRSLREDRPACACLGLDRRGAQEGRRSGFVPLPQGVDGRMSHLRRGWYWGRQEFAQRALEFADVLIRKGKSRAYQRSRERLAHGTVQAEKLLKEGSCSPDSRRRA
jgi:hypothetical protein